MDRERKKVFLSYSWGDSAKVGLVRNALALAGVDLWFDQEKITAGQRISEAIEAGIKGSDYYLIVISETSDKSAWVKRELSLAIELSAKKKVAIVPVLIDDADIPFELKGLLYIDMRADFAHGMEKLVEFFTAQVTTVAELETRVIIRQSIGPDEAERRSCEAELRKLELGDLRFKLSKRLGLPDIEVLWFDLFHAQMRDEAPAANVALACVQLLDRARREETIFRLVDILCRNHPTIARS